jgi:hypothetical protein
MKAVQLTSVGGNDCSVSDFLWKLTEYIWFSSEINEGRTGGLCWCSENGPYLTSIEDQWTVAFFCCRLMRAVDLTYDFFFWRLMIFS